MTEQNKPHPFLVGDRARCDQKMTQTIDLRPVLIVRTFRSDRGVPMVEYRYEHEIMSPVFGQAPADQFTPLPKQTNVQRIIDNGFANFQQDAPKLPDWRTQPKVFLSRVEDQHAAVDEILGTFLTGGPRPLALTVVRLLEAFSAELGYLTQNSNERIRYGSIAIPVTPDGLGTLRKLKTMAREFARSHPVNLGAEVDSSFARMVLAIDKGAEGSAMLGVLRNVSTVSTAADGPGVRLDLDLNWPIVAAMPSGFTLPKVLIGNGLLDQEVDGSDIEEITRKLRACTDGVSGFLRRFDVHHYSHEECDQCGSDTEGIEECESFTLTEEMIEVVDDEGYLDQLQDYFGVGESSTDFETLLCDNNDTELRALLAPAPKKETTARGTIGGESIERKVLSENGISYNAHVWRFEPDYSAVEGIEDLDFSGLARLLPALTESCVAHAVFGVLPPVPGELLWIGYCHRQGNKSWSWDPVDGTLSHVRARAGVRLEYRPIGGSMSLVTSDGALAVESGVVRCAAYQLGPVAESWFGIAQAKGLDV